MYHRKAESRRTVAAPAKLNLYLEVLGRRDDGYHELETLMVPVRLGDSLSLVSTPPAVTGEAGAILLTIRLAYPLGQAIDASGVPSPGASNLVVRALELLRERSGCLNGACIELVKRIPVAAGLGGGSSDAAAALRLANRAWGLDWCGERLAELAAELGSDVPFFLGRGAAVCRGRGERVEPLDAATRLHFVIVKPPFGLNTPDVYRAHDDLSRATAGGNSRDRLQAIRGALRRGTLTELRHSLSNRLEAAAASLSPWVDEARSTFARLDFIAHQLSGSGTAYFGVCRHAHHARRMATILRTRQLGLVYATHSCR